MEQSSLKTKLHTHNPPQLHVIENLVGINCVLGRKLRDLLFCGKLTLQQQCFLYCNPARYKLNKLNGSEADAVKN
jgi:hypothetical protein